MQDSNPYEAPRAIEARRRGPAVGMGAAERRRLAWWGAVFVANMPVPLLFGTSMTDRRGLIGLAAAATAMAAVGGLACVRSRRLGTAMIVGGTAVAMSQLVPIAQVVAGAAAMRAGAELGLVDRVGDEIGEAAGLIGGAFVTLATGGLLIASAAAIGLVLQVVTPGRWWVEPPRGGRMG